MINTNNLSVFKQEVDKNTICVAYFSHDKCNVCKVLLPKIEELLSNYYPEIKLIYSNVELHPEIPAQNSIFTVPGIIVFVEGKEYKRYSRNLSIDILDEDLKRPYNILIN